MSDFKKDGRLRSWMREKVTLTSHSISFSTGNRRPGETAPQEAQKIKKTTQGGGKGRNRGRKAAKAETSRPPSDCVPPERIDSMRERREERLQLEQSIAGVAGGPTGLLAALDVMVYDTREKNPVGFQCHAEGYFWRLEQLQSYLKRYQEIFPEKELESAPLYRELLAEGDRLRETLEAPEGLTDGNLDRWRENMLGHIDLYGDKKEGDHER